MKAGFIVVLVLLLAAPAAAHDIERAEALLIDVSAHRRAAAEAAVESARAESTFRLGETVETLDHQARQMREQPLNTTTGTPAP